MTGGVGKTVPVINKPAVDFPTYYSSTNPGPAAGHGCGVLSSGVPANFFDNNTAMNMSNGTINLFPAANYKCIGSSGEIDWDASKKTLTFVKIGPNDPQFFFDGNLILAGNTTVTYKGRGQLFFTGIISMTGQYRLCGANNCSNSWDNDTNQLFLFADCWKDAAGDLTQVTAGDPTAWISPARTRFRRTRGSTPTITSAVTLSTRGP